MMNDDDIIKEGLAAMRVLTNDDLMAFISDEKTLMLEAISNTQPHEVKTRESLYAQHHALTDFFRGLNQRAERAKELLEASCTPKDMTD